MNLIREKCECIASMNGQRYGGIARIWVVTMLLLLAANILTANAEQINKHKDSRTNAHIDDDIQVTHLSSYVIEFYLWFSFQLSGVSVVKRKGPFSI